MRRLNDRHMEALRFIGTDIPRSMKEVAQCINGYPTMATRVVNTLERHGLVRRIGREGWDGRFIFVEITDAGREVAATGR